MKFNPNEALETEEPLDLHSNVKILTQILEKLSKKCLIIPTGSRDRKEIENATLQHFVQRLRNRPILPGYEKIQYLKETLCNLRLEYTKDVPFMPWKMEDLEKVLSKLKKGKAKDPYGLVSEMFRPENIGLDLKHALLKLLNKVNGDGCKSD